MKLRHQYMKHLGWMAVVMLLAGATACRKYIYQSPINSTYSEKFWTSRTSVEQAAIDMYGQLRSCLRAAPGANMNEASFFVNGDLVSGNFHLGAQDGAMGYSLKPTSIPAYNFSYVPYGESVLQNWSRFYQLIAQCNLILQNVPRMSVSTFGSEAVQNEYLGEALFIRAYTYFYITRIWGDPVYITQTYNNVDYAHVPPVARTSESLVLDSCIADLKTAAGYLDYAAGDPTRSMRANKGSIYALMAHIYAWKHDYANAHTACQELIDKGGYTLEPMDSYKNIWQGQTSQENIFTLAMSFNQNDPNFNYQGDWAEAQFSCFATFLKGPIVDNQKSSCWIIPSPGGFADIFFDMANDKRFPLMLSYTPASSGDEAGYMLTKYTNFVYQNPDTKQLPYVNNNLVIFRLSDIYLLNAEALAYTNDLAGASHNLSFTEERAGIHSYQQAVDQYGLLDETVIERGRELIGEGSWYYDMIRTDSTQGWLEWAGYPSDRVKQKGYYWPLDMTVLFPQDNLLTQNPWWATHD